MIELRDGRVEPGPGELFILPRGIELLNEVRYRGGSYVIVRNGEAVASLSPPPGSGSEVTLGELLDRLAAVGGHDPDFADDLEDIQRRQPTLPGGPWAS